MARGGSSDETYYLPMGAKSVDCRMAEEKRMAVVKIERGLELADALRKFVIIVDGREIARIKYGETLELPVAIGTHEIFCKTNWLRSNKITFFMEIDDQIRRFRVRPATSGWKVILWPVYLTFLSHKYLELREVQGETK